jgi:hypothetical protein
MALNLARPVSLRLHTPHNFLWSRVLSDLQQVISIQMSHEASLDATNFYYRFTQRLGGLSRVAFQVSENFVTFKIPPKLEFTIQLQRNLHTFLS